MCFERNHSRSDAESCQIRSGIIPDQERNHSRSGAESCQIRSGIIPDQEWNHARSGAESFQIRSGIIPDQERNHSRSGLLACLRFPAVLAMLLVVQMMSCPQGGWGLFVGVVWG